MKVIKIKIIFWTLLLTLWKNIAHCSVSGISYMDPLKIASVKSNFAPGEDPCNPLYWYPKNIPEYCNLRNSVTPTTSEEPPVASPLPPSPPELVRMPPIPTIPVVPPPIPIMPPSLPILPMPSSLIAGSPPLSIFPTHLPPPMISISNPYLKAPLNPIPLNLISSPNILPYSSSFQQVPTGFIPGMHGLVTKNGGINIMPFSDVYADMLEKHKNKILRRKLHKILDRYDPYSRDYRNLRKYEKYFTDD